MTVVKLQEFRHPKNPDTARGRCFEEVMGRFEMNSLRWRWPVGQLLDCTETTTMTMKYNEVL